MKKLNILLLVFTLGIVLFSINWAVSDSTPGEREKRSKVIDWVDNNAYWKRMAEQGLAVLNPDVKAPPAVYTGSRIDAACVITEDSPDVPVIDVGSSTQSENSSFVDLSDENTMLNSNNSTSVSGPPSYGADYLYTFDFGETFDGSKYGAGGNNQGDPATGIGTDGRWYVNYIANSGQAIAYSDDQGASWTRKQIVPNPGQLADKNHMWIDALKGSPYENNLYVAWTDFGGTYDNHIMVSYSDDNGETWSAKTRISLGVNAGNHNQGVNLSTGPNGEVYAVWSIYDGWPQDEKAIGFCKSSDGGATWDNSFRIIDNIRGIRNSGVPQNMRVNSFPSMAVDVSGGDYNGRIYVVWTNVGVPGQNSGSDRDVYLIYSDDEGTTWTEPIRVNQDPINQGKAHYLPWITCDPANGTVSIIWYDNRNTSSNQAEAWVGTSNDGGDTWEDFKVSDVAFTPSPIPGMASGYFGDYLGITAYNGQVYPTWTDNRSGHAMTYVSPFVTITVTKPFALVAQTDQETGACDLNWQYNHGSGFKYFRLYRNDALIAETTDTTYTDSLQFKGYYTYKVTAYYGGTTESDPAVAETQWGSSNMVVLPGEHTANLEPNDSVTQQMLIKNTGELELEFSLSPFFKLNSTALDYAAATGGGEEFIHRVVLAGIDNYTAFESYGDFTNTFAQLEAGETYEIEVTNGNAYQGDQCAVWVDWNRNGEFEESPVVLSPDETYAVFTGEITVPTGSAQGDVRMRIRLAGPGEMSAYGDTKYGEVEDYTLLIASWLTLVPDEGVLAAGDSMYLDLTFNSTDLDIGVYTETVKFVSNDLYHPFINVPCTLNVTDLSVTATADPEAICLGSETQLNAVPQGGSGTYTFSWTSIPEGFTSDLQNPVVAPTENTTYIVAVNDGILTMIDSVNVTVNPLPEVNLGEDQVLCGETEYLLDAGNEGATYLWSTGETTQTITATGNGPTEFWVEVTNEFGCASSDTVTINFAELPVVDLGVDTVICHNQSYVLDAGNEGATYLWSTGETTQTIEIDTSNYDYGVHIFSVVVTNEFGCEGTDEVSVEVRNCLGIGENSQVVDMQLFPNPSTGTFKLKLESPSNRKLNIKVVSLSGKVVYETRDVQVTGSYTQQIDLSSLSSGVYSVFAEGDDFVIHKKIVIRK